jgi:hypothetical protein
MNNIRNEITVGTEITIDISIERRITTGKISIGISIIMKRRMTSSSCGLTTS